jgi:hypothetical protein
VLDHLLLEDGQPIERNLMSADRMVKPAKEERSDPLRDGLLHDGFPGIMRGYCRLVPFR